MLATRWKTVEVDYRRPLQQRSGMPKVAKTVSESVFFLFRHDPKTGRIVGPEGTGVLIARESKRLPGELHYYAVTNRHVACEGGASIIRLNTHDGGSRFIELDPSEWHFKKSGDDLAAADLGSRLDPTGDEIKHNNETGFVDQRTIEKLEIGPGEDVFMCGLFASHHGGERNVPTVRFGNLSMLASDQAPVELGTGASRPCHLADMRSRSGYSGSPVFVYRTFGSDLTTAADQYVGLDETSIFMGLLGIHCGQFMDEIEVRKLRKPRSERKGDPISEGDELEIQSSMTVIVPAWRITELLDLEVFEMSRAKRDEERESHWKKRPRAEAVSSARPSDENPSHREDFTRLVGAAARKPPQED